MSRYIRAVVIAAIASTLVHCPSAKGACTTSADCAAGAICDPANHICVTANGDAGTQSDGGCVGCPANFQALSCGTSYAGHVQTGGTFSNVGNQGEPTPGGVSGSVVQTGGSYSNYGGFNASNPP